MVRPHPDLPKALIYTGLAPRRATMGAGEETVPASDYRALQHQVRELQRLLGKKTLENEILREALDLAQPKKRPMRSSPVDRDSAQ